MKTKHEKIVEIRELYNSETGNNFGKDSRAGMLVYSYWLEKKLAHLYSAGEEQIEPEGEVSDEEIRKELKHSIHFLKTPKEINRIWAIGEHMAKWMRSKLTRPTVSGGEIKAFMKYMYHLGADNFEITNLDSTIDDLLKNGIATAKD